MAKPKGQLDVFWHYGDSLSMYRTQIGVLEQTHQISFGRFLKKMFTLQKAKKCEILNTTHVPVILR